MKIIYFSEIDSTQKFLIKKIKNGEINSSLAVITDIQSQGVGSRNNIWNSNYGDILFSIALKIKELPQDLAISSSSIYFAYILKELINKYSNNLWLKWPNDLYINKNKIGGIITNIINNNIVVGVGINLNNKNFSNLNISFKPYEILEKYIQELEKNIKWIDIFNKYKLEFYRNRDFFANIHNKYQSLDKSILNLDGSITIDSKKSFSLR